MYEHSHTVVQVFLPLSLFPSDGKSYQLFSSVIVSIW